MVISMLDRAIGLLGIALALIFGLAPLTEIKLPLWLTYSGVAFGILLIGVAGGLIAGSHRIAKPTNERQDIDTSLFLQFSDAHTAPIEKNQRNIQAWYALFTASIYVDAQDVNGKSVGSFNVPPRWNVFVLFDKPPIFRQVVSECRGPNNPKCAVQTANGLFSIVSIEGDVTGATLEVSIIK